jgi:hypothetical protein
VETGCTPPEPPPPETSSVMVVFRHHHFLEISGIDATSFWWTLFNVSIAYLIVFWICVEKGAFFDPFETSSRPRGLVNNFQIGLE